METNFNLTDETITMLTPIRPSDRKPATYRSILVPLDGSSLAERVLPTAKLLTEIMGARLVLMQVVPKAPTDKSTDGANSSREDSQMYLRSIAGRLSEEDVAADITVSQGGPADEILAEISCQRADLVVISTHGQSGYGRWVYGSTAEAVLTRSPAPVLLVRAMGPHVPLAPEDARARFLVPLDGSAFAEAALPHAANLAHALDATLVLLRVLRPSKPRAEEFSFMGPVVAPHLLEEERIEAEMYLREVAERLAGFGVRSQRIVRIGPAAETIIEAGRARAVTLIVMATQGRSGLERLSFGSVTTKLLHRSDLPILLVRPLGVHTNQATANLEIAK